MTTCRSCSAIVDSGAKWCPQCGAQNPSWPHSEVHGAESAFYWIGLVVYAGVPLVVWYVVRRDYKPHGVFGANPPFPLSAGFFGALAFTAFCVPWAVLNIVQLRRHMRGANADVTVAERAWALAMSFGATVAICITARAIGAW